jgi:hypothetical protein
MLPDARFLSVPPPRLMIYYAPEDQPIDRVVGLYAHATRYIYVSVYALTAPSVVKALVEAKRIAAWMSG